MWFDDEHLKNFFNYFLAEKGDGREEPESTQMKQTQRVY